jgi:uncharacterized protein (TIGR03083 family)
MYRRDQPDPVSGKAVSLWAEAKTVAAPCQDGRMLIEEHIARVRAEGDHLARVVAAGDLAARTPTCPEWTLGDLARHVGRVHRWAATFVRDGVDHEASPEEEQAWWGAMPDDADVPAWVQAGVDGLVAALTQAPPELACWSFLPAPSPLAFWARRQAHETTIHRVDAERAVSDHTSGIDPAFAVDGVDELLLGFFGRRNRVRSPAPATLGLIAADADAAWLTRLTEEGARSQRSDSSAAADADAVVTAPAATLYCGVWNRTELAAAGDRAVLARWRDQAHIRWS